jgi:hypothetical protein
MACAAVLALTAAGATAANATVYEFTYSGGGETATGTFTTNGSQQVVSGSGVFDFPSLAPITASIVPGSGSDGAFIWDNQFPVDAPGLLFEDASAQHEINLFDLHELVGVGTVTDASLYVATPPSTQNYIGFNSGTLTISAVPEPATWVMLILGAAMIGFATRRRREGVTLAA